MDERKTRENPGKLAWCHWKVGSQNTGSQVSVTTVLLPFCFFFLVPLFSREIASFAAGCQVSSH